MGNAQPRTIQPQERTALFQQEKNGGTTYRIPSLIYIEEDQMFLAFAEKRSSPNDSDAKILMMQKGTFSNGSVEWSPKQELHSATLPQHRTMNPCPVYDKETKKLFLFFICVPSEISECRQICEGKNAAKLCYVCSEDKGKSWKETVDLTESVIGEKIKDWATFAVGPGHGVQLESGKLIIPAYTYYVHCRCTCFPCLSCVHPHAFYFYSTDSGNTWLLGEKIENNSCECEMAEIVDNTHGNQVYCNARNTGCCCKVRVEALGDSNKINFDTVRCAQALVEQPKGCQGSVIAFPGLGSIPGHQDGEMAVGSTTNTWLLFSHPTKCKRRDLGVYLNRNPSDTSGWEGPWIINEGPSGYSDLTYCADKGLFGCLLECGENSEVEQIDFMIFSI